MFEAASSPWRPSVASIAKCQYDGDARLTPASDDSPTSTSPRPRMFVRSSATLGVVALALCSGLAPCAAAQSIVPDPSLMTAIRKIPAIDNHAHPPKLIANG